jgi:hypothetical protein
MPDLATNVLYYGDNLDILRRYLPDAAVDLIDLDPAEATYAYLTNTPHHEGRVPDKVTDSFLAKMIWKNTTPIPRTLEGR